MRLGSSLAIDAPRKFAAGGGGGPTDPFWSNVTLLLHADGTNGSTTITDSSSLANTVTSQGATISTAQSKFNGTSLYVNGRAATPLYATVQPSLFNFGTATDFTVEFWIYPLSWNFFDQIIGQWGGPDTFQISNLNNAIGIQDNTGTATSGRAVANIALNTWHHFAFSRVGSSLKFFQNGVGYAFDRNVNIAPSLGTLVGIGKCFSQDGFGSNCYLDELRVTNGVGRYTADFTTPTAAFPNA